GHSGLWGVNIDEGTRQDAQGRRWEVQVMSGSQAYAEREDAQSDAAEARKQSQQESSKERQREAVLKALRLYAQGETLRVLREAAGLTTAVLHDRLGELMDEGDVEACVVLKNGRNEQGHRLRIGGTVGTVGNGGE